jgi:hypothetical protein
VRPETIEAARGPVFWTTHRLHATIPSVLAEGERFRLRMTAFGPDGLPTGSFDRAVSFDGSRGVEGLPASARFDPAEGGHLAIDGLTAVGPGHAVVVATPEGSPGAVESNPAWVRRDPAYRVYWGDIHVHTEFGECHWWAVKPPEFCYEYARDASHLDVCSAVDHLRGLVKKPHRWPRLQELARALYEPGRFVPLLAFESSHAAGYGGDINAYFLDADAPLFWLDREDMKGIQPKVPIPVLWEFLDGYGKPYMTIPHHTARRGKHRSFADPVYDPAREPLFEVYSWWGSSERRHTNFPLAGGSAEEPAFLADALRAGCRYGVIASSDDHQTLPGGEGTACRPCGRTNLANYVHHGLMAVKAPELTREAVFAAMSARRTWGTTFARSLLDFRVEDVEMGREAPVGRSDAMRKRRRVTAEALVGGDPWRVHVTLVRNGEDLETKELGRGVTLAEFSDDSPLDDVALRGARFHPDPFLVYYIRVEETDHQTQWSSPVWLDLA